MTGPRTHDPTRTGLPQVWRVPPWQPAALLLLATVLIAADIYTHLSPGAMIMTLFIATISLAAAVVALRYLLVADEDGIWVRRMLAEELVAWGDVKDIEMTTTHRHAMTVRVTRVDGSHVDVPPSLLLPTLPTSMRKVRSIIHGVATHLAALAARYGPTPDGGHSS